MLSVVCPQCDKEYQVKEEFAGKRFRCKACETVVTVGGGSAKGSGGARSRRAGEPGRSRPQPARSRDPLDDLDEYGDDDGDDDGDDAFDDGEDYGALPPRRAPSRSSKSSKKGSGASSGSMPGSVVAAVVIEGLCTAKNLFVLAVGLWAIVRIGVGLSDVARILGTFAALACNAAFLIGTFQRRSWARTVGIVTGILGAVAVAVYVAFMAIAGVALTAMMGSSKSEESTVAAGAVGAGFLCVTAVTALVCAVYVGQVTALFRESAKKFYRR